MSSRWTRNRNVHKAQRQLHLSTRIIPGRTRFPETSRSQSPEAVQNNSAPGPSRSIHHTDESFQGNNDNANDDDDEMHYSDAENYSDEFNRFHESNSDEEQTSSDDDEDDIGAFLVRWQIEFKVTERAMDALLCWLKDHHFANLPKTIKTLKI